MSAVGKILVFLCLVFSLVVGAFGVMGHISRSHWVDNHNKMKAQLDVALGTIASYKAQAEGLSKERALLNETLRKEAKDFEVKTPEDAARIATLVAAELARLRSLTKDLRDNVSAVQKQLLDEKTTSTQMKTAMTTLRADLDRRQVDVRKIEDQLKTETVAHGNTIVLKNRMRDDKVAAEIEATSLRDKNLQMLARLTDLERTVVLMKANPGIGGGGVRRPGGGGGVAGMPAPDGLEGRITQVAEKGLVRISIGSDNGLSLDHKLEVFRLGTTPKYLGKIRIVSVFPGHAVGQVDGRPLGDLKVNDQVASNILGGR